MRGGQDALSTGEPAEQFADKEGLFPAPVGESFGVDLAKTDVVDPAVDADAARAAQHGIVRVLTATQDVALEDAQEDEHGAGLCVAGAGLADGGGDGEAGAEEGLEDGEEEGRGEVGRVVEGEGERDGGEERVEGPQQRGHRRAGRWRCTHERDFVMSSTLSTTMATFEYVEMPDAVRLKPDSLAPATKVTTSLPDTARTSSAPLPAKSALALVPQMLLSLPAQTTAVPATTDALLSTRDPLSLPLMTANFRRFVSKVGLVFWLQDRVEEVVLWKKGWKRTAVWLAAYAFLCASLPSRRPRIHLVQVTFREWRCCSPISCCSASCSAITLIQARSQSRSASAKGQPTGRPIYRPFRISWGPCETSVHTCRSTNSMSSSDAHDALVPLVPLLVAPAPPSRLSTPPAQPHHPLLIATLLSFLVLLPLLMTDLLPLRLLFFLAGAGSVGAFHPRIRGSLSTISTALSGSGPGLSFQLSIHIPCLPNPLPIIGRRIRRPSRSRTFTLTLTPRDVLLFLRHLTDDDKLDDPVWNAPLAHVDLWENERWVQDPAEGKRRKSLVTLVREGEEEGGEDDAASTTSTASAGTATGGTWSKANLKPNERVGWTRGRDGWSGVGGEVRCVVSRSLPPRCPRRVLHSSNLTFSLSPGWAFVETEGWRPDLIASWAVDSAAPSASVCAGADEGTRVTRLSLSSDASHADGWTYTTDTWTHPRPDARPCDGWVTRRRRWVRRVCLAATPAVAS
jgi:hypothetical protein